ncbi:MAG: glycosyltransferase [Pseudomonadota bacterium]
MVRDARIGVVLIGRNEGERLVVSLASVMAEAHRAVYVDSGSTDDSVAAARAVGAEVVTLDPARPFTAARARNEGFDRLRQDDALTYVQFIDGDCELQAGWMEEAAAFLDAHPQVAVVCGRRRERFPDASIWNKLIDREWDTPVGEAKACGGDAMMRVSALEAVNGFNPRLIAGEEPELCVRLRQAGWKVHRIDAEMTLHDAALTRFSQWWRRTVRGGHAFAEGAAIHGAPPERHKVTETRRALIWGFGLPLVAVVGAITVSPWMAAVLLLWPIQMVRMMVRGYSPEQAVFFVLGRVPEAIGASGYWFKRLTNRDSRIIEYK